MAPCVNLIIESKGRGELVKPKRRKLFCVLGDVAEHLAFEMADAFTEERL